MSDGTATTAKDELALERSGKPFRPRLWKGLSAKFLLLTVLFVMITEVLILIPSVANYRQNWLMGRLDQARAASGIFDSALSGDEALQRSLLDALDAQQIVLRTPTKSEMIDREATMPVVAATVEEAGFSPLPAIRGAFDQLRHGGDRLIRIIGKPDAMDKRIELVVSDTELQSGMLVYMRNIILISLFIAFVTAFLIYLATRALLIRPVQRMAEAMLAFGAAPQDATRIIEPTTREDEVGQAERQLAGMQTDLHRTLGQQRRLAELGLAVSKINHDMRNILSSAQLVTDRLADVEDPVVQRVAPRLIRALDRAVGYSEGVLEYGRANEAPPAPTSVDLRPLVEEVIELALVDHTLRVEPRNQVPLGFSVVADREHLLRVLLNVARNAVQAMGTMPDGDPRILSISAKAVERFDTISVGDSGPGLPARVRETLFSAFGTSGKSSGTGLGLAIARELIEAHGGTIGLERSDDCGTVFAIRLPRRGR